MTSVDPANEAEYVQSREVGKRGVVRNVNTKEASSYRMRDQEMRMNRGERVQA